MRVHQRPDALRQFQNETFRIAASAQRILRQAAHFQIRQHQGGFFRADIDADDAGAFAINVKKFRLSSARQIPGSTHLHPAFGDQLLRDHRDGTALQTRMTGEIGTRNRLMLANEIQHNPAIDVAGRSNAGDLKIIEINLASDGARFAVCSTATGGHILLLYQTEFRLE